MKTQYKNFVPEFEKYKRQGYMAAEEVNEKNMLFQRYESFLNQEKNTSSNMIKVLKYLTQVTPKRFKVTEMSLENKLKSKKQSSCN